MTTSGISTIAFGVAALVSLPLSAAYADAPTPAGPNTPSLSEPAPTPGWAVGGSSSTVSGSAMAHRPTRVRVRHVAWRNEPHYVRSSSNFVANTANGVVGGVEDLGSVAAYPLYCFPNYGSCHVRLPYRP